MPLDALENRALLRNIIDILAEPLEGEAKDTFVRGAVKAMNKVEPAPGKAQKRPMFRIVPKD